MKKIKSILIILTISLFASCEGVVWYEGTIYDAQTKEPLDNVQCVIVRYKNENDFTTYSDSIGYYYVSSGLVGMVFGRPKYNVEFSKQGYKTQIVKEPTDIYLEKE